MIDAVLGHQIGVGALLCNGAAVQNQNAIGINDARQAMRRLGVACKEVAAEASSVGAVAERASL